VGTGRSGKIATKEVDDDQGGTVGRRIGVLFADEAGMPRLEEVSDQRTRGGTGDCNVSFPQRSRVRADLVLISYRSAVRFLAGVEDDDKADDIRWAYRLRLLTALGRPVDTSRLRAMLRKDQRRPLEQPGELTEKAGTVVLDTLLAENPELGSVIGALFGVRDLDLPAPRKAALAEERDTLASLCAFTGAPDLMPVAGFLTEDEAAGISGRDSFLPSTPDVRAPREDPLIEHDANTFLGWTRQESDQLAVRNFSDGNGRSLQVMNVNRWPIETRLGTDLIYYHEQRRSLVLVQYKRMVPDGSSWRYRVDEDFLKQLDRMRALDEGCLREGSGGEYRMVPTPSFVKICQVDTLDIDSISMISGMCMPREQVENHLNRPDSPKYFDFHTTRDYLTSTLFGQLVALGAFGTRGTATDLVAREIELSLRQGKSVTAGVYSDELGRRPSWRTHGKKIVRSKWVATPTHSQQTSLW
jgi:hypothetical protein